MIVGMALGTDLVIGSRAFGCDNRGLALVGDIVEAGEEGMGEGDTVPKGVGVTSVIGVSVSSTEVGL